MGTAPHVAPGAVTPTPPEPVPAYEPIPNDVPQPGKSDAAPPQASHAIPDDEVLPTSAESAAGTGIEQIELESIEVLPALPAATIRKPHALSSDVDFQRPARVPHRTIPDDDDDERDDMDERP